MTTRLYTDEELWKLRMLAKRVTNPGARWSEKPAESPTHKQRTFKAKASSKEDVEARFLIYERQNLLDVADYSCGIVYLSTGGSRLVLARYNGPSHEHGNINHSPHIHRATETAIRRGRKPESAAEATNRYETLEGALACMIDDFHLSGISATPDHPSLFDGSES